MNNLPIITCDNCGACCTKMGTPPFVRHELFDLREDLREEVLKYEKEEPDREFSGKPCFWFNIKTKKCSQYEHRPHTCRDFEVGCDPCKRWREDAGIK